MFVCLKTHFLQMKSALLPDQRGVPAEWPYKERRPPPLQSLVSALWFSSPSVIRSRGRKQPVEIGSPQQVLWLLFQVGGELVGRTSSAGISHCPLVLWHTRHFLPPRSRWLIFTAACVCNPGGTDSRQGQTVVCKCWVLFIVVAVVSQHFSRFRC